jgi:hypothetical protein
MRAAQSSAVAFAMCGARMAFLDGTPLRSCALPVSALGDGGVTTIEGLSGREAAAVQRAWVARNVPQCGYCQSGKVMIAVALLKELKRPTETDQAMYSKRLPLRHLCAHSRTRRRGLHMGTVVGRASDARCRWLAWPRAPGRRDGRSDGKADLDVACIRRHCQVMHETAALRREALRRSGFKQLVNGRRHDFWKLGPRHLQVNDGGNHFPPSRRCAGSIMSMSTVV